MRGSGGYGGPVAHWWQQSFVYTGPGLDWRYEGIITGYLSLWEQTGDEQWLAKACRAGDDLVDGQLGNGHFLGSAFEINPASAGTPHEAACDAALLRLALALRGAGRAGWGRYAACAERNLRTFYIKQLWNEQMRAFSDGPGADSFVPNKAATASESLFLLADLAEDGLWVERYALPTLDRILAHQMRGGLLDGAIAQNSFGEQVVDKYFPIYIARCVTALLRGYAWNGDERYVEAALRAMRFVARYTAPDGSLPTVMYPNGRVNSYPSWVAPLGDVLRAADELQPYGFDADFSPVVQRLLAGQDSSGGIQTAVGFAAQAGGRHTQTPDARDVLHVAGWCDKAFRYLASHCDAPLPEATSERFERECTFRGHTLRLLETPSMLDINGRHSTQYRWVKGESRPRIASWEFWLR
jgi:hypothetical protein